MPRPHLHEAFELFQLAQGTEQAPRALLGLDGEVRAGKVSDEERVPGEQDPGLLAPACVLQGEREVLGPVAGGGHGPDPRLSDLDHVALFERLVLVPDAGVFGDVDLRPGRFHETPLAGEVVGVVVGLYDVGDPKPVLLGYLEVLPYLPLRVYDRRLAAVGDDVGRAAQVLVQDFSEKHGDQPLASSSTTRVRSSRTRSAMEPSSSLPTTESIVAGSTAATRTRPSLS